MNAKQKKYLKELEQAYEKYAKQEEDKQAKQRLEEFLWLIQTISATMVFLEERSHSLK